MSSAAKISSTPHQAINLQELFRNPAFHDFVNKLAAQKVRRAVKAGKLKVEHDEARCTQFIPRMDLIDSKDSPNIVGIFELPGIKTENISLSITDGELTIMGERRSPYSKKFVPHSRIPIPVAESVALGEMDTVVNSSPDIEKRELRFGTFSRTLPVPRGLKEHEVTAGLSDGLLTVTWPRSPSSPTHIHRSSAVPHIRAGNTTPPQHFSSSSV